MNFRPELAEQVMAGKKTVTRRFVSNNPRSPWWRQRCALQPGRDYAVCPGRGKEAIGRVRIISATKVPAIVLDVEEARREGFASIDAFMDYWREMHGKAPGHEPVWRIAFEVVVAP